MSVEEIYNITYKPSDKNYYQLNGPKGELFQFFNKSAKNYKLESSSGEDRISVEIKGLLENDILFNYKNFTPLSNIKFSIKFSDYKITGSYKKGEILIDWTWKPLNNWATCELIDKNNNDKVLAKIKGFSLKREASGTLTIGEGVDQDFIDAIIMSACIVWHRRYEKNEADGLPALAIYGMPKI